jgi:hypothetical protein
MRGTIEFETATREMTDPLNSSTMAGGWPCGKADLMTTHSNTPSPEGDKPPSFGIGTLLFAVILVVLLFFLLQSMRSHRFFRGGRVHPNGSIGP